MYRVRQQQTSVLSSVTSFSQDAQYLWRKMQQEGNTLTHTYHVPQRTTVTVIKKHLHLSCISSLWIHSRVVPDVLL